MRVEWWSGTRRRVALLSAGAIAAMLVAVAIVSQPGHTDPSSATSVDPGLARAFAVLRGPAVTDDADKPGSLDRLIATGQAGGANPGLARRAVTADGTVFYVVPGDGTLCLAAVGAGSCDRAEKAEASGLILSSKLGTDPQASVRVQGVVPDGVSSVTIAGDGVSKEIAVHDNAFAYLGPNVTSVSWKGQAGVVTQVAGLPEGASTDVPDGAPEPATAP
jgi:hypothetical protein